MSAGPLVSIVIRTRNRPLGLREALGSLAAQSYAPLEVLVVNDGGAPVRPIVEAVLGPTPLRWSLIEWPDNRGRERAGNVGLRAARGEYLGFLDDDDALYPEHVAVLMAFFAANPDRRVAYTDALQANQEPDASEPTGYRTLSRELALSWDVNPVEFREQNFIPLHCVLFHRDCLVEVGGLDEELRRLEDWDFLLRLSWRFPMTHLRQVTGEYRYRTDHPRIADPRGFAATPELFAARSRIQAKQPERDAWVPATSWRSSTVGAGKPTGSPEPTPPAAGGPIRSGRSAAVHRLSELRKWWVGVRRSG